MMASGIAANSTPSYAEVADVIEALVYKEGRRYPIPGMDFEDIAQEIRMECIRVLQSYDSTRIGPSPYKYLQTCVRNFLYNKRRGIWVPNNPPCVRCPLWDKVKKTCTIDEVDCDKIVQYKRNMATKAAIRQPNSLEFDITDYQHEEGLDAIVLDQSIRNALPGNLIQYYEKMLMGEKIPARVKKQIRDIATGVINDA
jgi:hypothetical protein